MRGSPKRTRQFMIPYMNMMIKVCYHKNSVIEMFFAGGEAAIIATALARGHALALRGGEL